jgi:hypothetical protein
VIVASLELPYEQLVARAHVVDRLSPADRARVLERIVARYPEAVATVLDDMGAEAVPEPPRQPQPRPWAPALDLTEEPCS